MKRLDHKYIHPTHKTGFAHQKNQNAHMGISKNLAFYGLNPSPFSGREGYKEFLEMTLFYFLSLQA